MKRVALALVMVWSLVTLSVWAQGVAENERANIEASVKERVLAYYRTVDTLDIDALMRLWSREKTIGYASAGKVTSSVDAITGEWKTSSALRLRQSFQCHSVEVRVLAPDTAMTMCIGPIRIEYKNGNISHFNYLGTMLWAKEATGWKVIFLQETSAAR